MSIVGTYYMKYQIFLTPLTAKLTPHTSTHINIYKISILLSIFASQTFNI